MTDRTVRLVLTGSAASAIAALEKVGITAEEAGAKTEAAFGDKLAGSAERTGGIFQKLGTTLGNWGVPFSESLSKVGDKVSEADTKGKKLGATLAEVGKVATIAGVVGFAVVAGESVKLATSFQQTTASIAAHADISSQAAAKIGDAFLSTGGKSTFSAQQIGAAFAPIAGQLGEVAGHALTAKESLTVMSAATSLAEGSGQDLNTVTAALAQTMQAYSINVKGASGASDVLFNASRATGVNVDELASTLAKMKMRLGDAAPSLAQSGGLMVELANNGVTGSRGVNMVASSLSGMVYPSSTAQKALSEMGVQLTDAHGKFIGVGPALDAIRAGLAKMPASAGAAGAAMELQANKYTLARLALEKQTPAIKAQIAALKAHDVVLTAQSKSLDQNSSLQQIFGKNAATLVPIIEGGSAALNEQAGKVGKLGSAHEAAEKQASTFKGTMEKLKSTGEDLGVKLGLVLIPIITRLGQIVSQVTNFLMQHKDIAIALAIVIGGVVVVAIAAYVIGMIAAAAATIAATWPILAVIAAVALFVAGIVLLVNHWTEVWQFIKKYSVEIAAAITLLLGPIGLVIALALLLATHWKQVFDFVKAAPHEAWQFIDTHFVQPIQNFFSGVVDFINSHWKLILAILTGPIGLAVLWINQHFQAVLDFFTGIPGKMAAVGVHMWDWVSGGFKMVIDTLIGWWDDFVGYLKIPAFSVGAGPFKYHFGGVDIGSSLKIPPLDTGGLTTGPTLAALSMNSVPEIVSPVPQLRQVISDALAAGGGGGQPVQLVLDGRVVGQLLWPHVRTAALSGTARNAVKVGLT